MSGRHLMFLRSRKRILFYLIYVVFILSVSMAFSRYTVRDGSSDGARVVSFGTEIRIYSGDPVYASSDTDIRLLATCSISEASSIREGVYACSVISINNLSDCTIFFDDLTFNENAQPDQMPYSNLIIDDTVDYIQDHRISDDDNGISLSALSYMQETMAAYNRQPSSVSDEHERAALEYMQTKYSSDPDFTFEGSQIDYDNTRLSDPDYLKQLIRVCNKLSLEKINKSYDGGEKLLPGESRSLLVISWAEHNVLYLKDSQTEADAMSHKDPTALIGGGNKDNVTRRFSFYAHFSQAD